VGLREEGRSARKLGNLSDLIHPFESVLVCFEHPFLQSFTPLSIQPTCLPLDSANQVLFLLDSSGYLIWEGLEPEVLVKGVNRRERLFILES